MRTVPSKTTAKAAARYATGRTRSQKFLLVRASRKRAAQRKAIDHWASKRKGNHNEAECVICQQLILARQTRTMGDSNPGEVFNDD